MKLIDLTGKIFGRLTVRYRIEQDNKHVYWMCVCSCGNEKPIRGSPLTSDKIKSCGCFQIESATLRGLSNHTHQMTGTATYGSWRAMMRRCYESAAESYSRYGGAGIEVCPSWHAFENFFADMGIRPEGTTLDRKDGSKNYEPENCRWSTPEQQAQNRRKIKETRSKYKGIVFDRGKWRAKLMVGGKVIELGRYDLEEDAAKAYDDAVPKYHGEFACPNNLNFTAVE
jgi:hypothetical protein